MAGLGEKIYEVSPVWLQNGLVSLYGYRLKRARYSSPYLKYRDMLLERDYSDLDAELSAQSQHLAALVKHAKSNSRFYRERFEGIEIGNSMTLDELQRLPVLEKQTLRENLAHIYTIDESQAIRAFTGGTTGTSLMVYFTKDDFRKRLAYLDAFKIRCGVDPFKDRKATFSGRAVVGGIASRRSKVFWRQNHAFRQRLYSTFDLSEGNMPLYINDLNRYQPQIINGFVSAIHQIASFVLENEVEFKFQPKAIFTTSETLLPYHRQAIEEAFRSRVFNQYASAEGAPFVTECIEGNLHYNLDTGVIEIVGEGEESEILVTSFTSHGTPLIRYRIGDRMVAKPGRCSCGSAHPLMASIDGRKVEYLLSSHGAPISLSHLADVIKGVADGVKEMQFVQNSLNCIQVNVVPDRLRYRDDIEQKIRKEMKYRFGNDAHIELQKVAAIEREPSGKKLLIKQRIIQLKTE